MESPLETAVNSPTAAVAPPPPPPLFNFATHLFGLNEARAGKIAYIDDAGTTTYGELEQRARRFATVLRTLGVHPEERVLLVMLDTVALPIAFLGALYAGVVPVVANTLLSAADYRYMLTHSHARVVIASGALVPNVTEAMANAEYDGCQLIVSEPLDGARPAAPLLEELND